MRRKLLITAFIVLSLSVLPALADVYEPFSGSMPAAAPQSDYSVGAASPDYVAAQSGDLDPFGASSSRANGRRRKPPSTGGDPTNPDIPAPIDGAVWVLLTLAIAYAARVKSQEPRQ